MVAPEDYQTAWIVYSLGAAGLLACLWWLVRKFALRNLIMVIAAVLLFMPYGVGTPYMSWAPAFLMCLFEGFFYGFGAMGRTGMPLLIAALSASILWLCLEMLVRWYKSRRPA